MQQAQLFLGAALAPVTADPVYQQIGAGDDGILYRILDQTHLDGQPKLLKVFLRAKSSNTVSQTEAEYLNTIRGDQVYREFKALKIIGSHPNFLNLYSNEVDACDVFLQDGASHPNSWAIQLNYVDCLEYISDVTKYMGYSWEMIDDTSHVIMNFNYRSNLLIYIMEQFFTILNILKRNDIQHRDLDSVNVKIKLPEFKVYVFDFARANLPDRPGFNHSDDPENIADDARTKIRALDNDLKRCDLESYMGIVQSIKQWRYAVKAYCNPIISFVEPDINRPDDFQALRLLLRNAFHSHVENEFAWVTPGQREEVKLENNLIGAFIESKWDPSLNIILLRLDLEVRREALESHAFVFNNWNIPNAKDNSARRNLIERNLRFERRIIHSREYTEHIEASTPSSKRKADNSPSKET